MLSPGAVVRVRERLWRVDGLSGETFTATPLDGRDLYARRFATALEEVTSGALPFPDPRATADPMEQDLLLRAYELSLIHGRRRSSACSAAGRFRRPISWCR